MGPRRARDGEDAGGRGLAPRSTPSRALRALALGVALAAATTARADDAPAAVVGRFVAGDGATLEVTRRGGALAVRLAGLDGAASWDGGALVVVGPGGAGLAGRLDGDVAPAGSAAPTRLAASADAEGRLVLTHGARAFARAGTEPWWRLRPATRAALAGPLRGLAAAQAEAARRWRAARYGDAVPAAAAEAEWAFDAALDPPRRRCLVALLAKLQADDVWRFVGALAYVGDDGGLLFLPSVPEAELRAGLAARGFGDWWWASKGRPWGVRSRWRGAQLHLRGGDPVNVHLDFVNPGDPPGVVSSAAAELGLALRHRRVDLLGWAQNHTAERVVAEVRGQGLDVDEPPTD